jgi:hypothetical protein
VNIPNRPGDIRFKAHQPYRHGSGLTFPFWLSILAGFVVVAVVVILIAAPSDNSYNPSLNLSEPTASNLSIPSKPLIPGFYASFATKDKKTSGRGKDELTFNYEHLKVISIHPRQIAGLVALGAIEFRPDATPSYTNAEIIEYIEHLNSNSRKRPYIIYGDVSITCGPLIRDDIGFAEAFVNDDDIETLNVDFSRRPRGPPSADRTVLEQSVRTIYVVGKIDSFSGPHGFHNSFMRTRVLDLGPSTIDRPKYDSAYEAWKTKVVALAARYHVPEAELLASAGARVDIEQGKVRVLTKEETIKRDYHEAHRYERTFENHDYERPVEPPAEHPAIP